MARSPALNKIKTHRIYTVWKAAEVLGKHRQTIIRWIKEKGLIADTSQRRWLIKGSDLKEFLGQRRQEARCQLALHHLYCLGCKSPQEPAGKFADYTHWSCRAYDPVSQLIYAAFRSKTKGLLPPRDECRRRGL